jgi:hypothetical protein
VKRKKILRCPKFHYKKLGGWKERKMRGCNQEGAADPKEQNTILKSRIYVKSLTQVLL